ncbi:MAG: DUF2062 domain-containing protein [Rhizobiales bacterium]|nr:DUF2062 domain-containing protein [Hyphomicrobiales bacterium]
MLFKRRKKLHLKQKFRNFFVPAKGIKRGFTYIWRRIWRINATPYAIAFGCAAGAFASCTPFLGFHFVIAAIIAFIFRANLLASALGTAIGNPLTFPFVWFIIHKIGRFILNYKDIDTDKVKFGWHMFDGGWSETWVILKPMLIGSVPFGLLVGGVTYFLVYRAVTIYQNARSNKFKS